MTHALNYFSTFSGIGGFEAAIQSVARKANCVGYCEIDKYADRVYQRHFPTHTNYGDITGIDSANLPAFELLVGGFPCQAFSLAGKRGGFGDIRGTLFFEIARIARQKQPRFLLLENVKRLLSHDKGHTFRTVISTLDELGYDCQWQVLNSKNFGVPQNRERVFIVGHLRGTPRPEIFPIQQDANPLITKGGAQSSNAIVSRTLTATDAKMHLDGNYIKQINNPKHSNDRVYDPDGLSPTLNTMQGGNRQPFIAAQRGRPSDENKYAQKLEPRKDGYTNTLTTVQKDNLVVQVREATRKGFATAGIGDAINLSFPNSKNRRGRVGKGIAHTLDTGMQQHTLTKDMDIRRLTPLECERLQGFSDGWTEGVSDTQRYKCLGNVVTVPVVRAIITRMFVGDIK